MRDIDEFKENYDYGDYSIEAEIGSDYDFPDDTKEKEIKDGQNEN